VAGAVHADERAMSVTQGPETVFSAPVEQILPALAGARPTGENGRVGGELVFWGYERSDGSAVFFFACARMPMPGSVDCAERVAAICTTRTNVLESREASGNVVRRSCRNVAVAAPGDTRPGCVDTEEPAAALSVGLVACG
jgi:hypothetical protein